MATVPQGVVGDRLPWGGEGQGGGVPCNPMLFVLMLISAMANIAILGIAVKYVRSLSTSDSREDDEVEIVWAKATRGGWGLGQVFEDKLFFTKDVMDDSFVPNNWKPKPVPQPAPKRAPPMRCARCTWCTRAHASGRIHEP